MPRLYYTLADYPHAMVEIECPKCGRHGRLRKANLVEQYGAGYGQPRSEPASGPGKVS